MRGRRIDVASLLLRTAMLLAVVITFAGLLFLVAHIMSHGLRYLKPGLFNWTYDSDNLSMMPAIINTLEMVVLSLLLAGPVGVGAAVYLNEYAKPGNRLVPIVRLTAETLSGIPSIVYGLFGALFFVKGLGWRLSMASGVGTLAIMILPLIMRTTEEALKSVPDDYRQGSYGLGAGKLRTVFSIVLPAAMPGVMAGIILAIGRIVGESAALIFTAGTVAQAGAGLGSPARTLAVHLYVLSNEGLHINETYATAVVLLIVVLLINALSDAIGRMLMRRSSHG